MLHTAVVVLCEEKSPAPKVPRMRDSERLIMHNYHAAKEMVAVAVAWYEIKH